MKSYAAVVYLHVNGHNNIQTNLMFSKMHLTPVSYVWKRKEL